MKGKKFCVYYGRDPRELNPPVPSVPGAKLIWIWVTNVGRDQVYETVDRLEHNSMGPIFVLDPKPSSAMSVEELLRQRHYGVFRVEYEVALDL